MREVPRIYIPLPANDSRAGGPMRPRTVFAMAVAGLLLIGGASFPGFPPAGEPSVFLPGGAARWREVELRVSGIPGPPPETGGGNRLAPPPPSSSAPRISGL